MNEKGTWEKPSFPARYDIGSGNVVSIIGVLNTGMNIGGLVYCPYQKWRLDYDGSEIRQWESPTEIDPREMFNAEIAPYVTFLSKSGVGKGDISEIRNRFLRSQAKTAKTAVQELTDKLWSEGKTLDFICTTCSKVHVGDKSTMKAMILSYAATRVLNSDGVHISISGNTGSGKSHVVSTVSKCLPGSAVCRSRLSDKAILYHELPPKTVIIMDDQELTDDFQELVKVASTDWDKPSTYRTVNNGKPIELKLPVRCVFWICKVNLNGDEQILDRQLIFWVDESPEQKIAITTSLMKRVSNPAMINEEERDLIVCRSLWNHVPSMTVAIPFSDRIGFDQNMDPRNIKLMLSLIQANALLHAAVREIDVDGNLQAIEDDFNAAKEIMNPLMKNEGGSQRLKLSNGASKILNYLASCDAGIVTYSDIKRNTGLTDTQLSQALKGRNDAQTDGLLSVCPAVEIVNLSESNGDEFSRTSISRKAVRWARETYLHWSGHQSGFWIKPKI